MCHIFYTTDYPPFTKIPLNTDWKNLTFSEYELLDFTFA